MDTASSVQGIKSLFRHPDLGLLIIRAALGFILLYSGYTKFMGGEETIHAVGLNINYLGLDVTPGTISTLFFGVLAAGIEVVCGLGLIVGYLFRSSSVALFMVMVVATLMKLDTSHGDPKEFGYPLVMALVLLGLLFTGSGRVSLQKD